MILTICISLLEKVKDRGTENADICFTNRTESENMPTDKEKLDWLCANCTYMEHKVKGVHPLDLKQSGYWPMTESDVNHSDPQLIGLTLDEYLEAMI